MAITCSAALPKDSPFLPPATNAQASKAGPSAYEFVGMTTFGSDTLLGIQRQADKRSFWVPVGKTAGEITAVSYDPKADEAVIRAESQTLTLKLRKGGVLAGIAATIPAPSPVSPAPVAQVATPVSVPTRPMTVQEEKEMEARMLVTDLLEIGQQQRKAYEEAQRKAAARAKSGPPAAPVSQPSAAKP